MTATRQKLTSLHGGYWAESQRPLISLVFLLPMLAVYEVGIVWLGKEASRNGAEDWLRRFLEMIGFSHYFLLPVLVCGALLAWHHVVREPWRFQGNVLYGMFMESVLLGFSLLLIAKLQRSLFTSIGLSDATDLLQPLLFVGKSTFSRIVGFFGAGVYEELLFRLMLMPVIVGALSLVGVKDHKGMDLGGGPIERPIRGGSLRSERFLERRAHIVRSFGIPL